MEVHNHYTDDDNYTHIDYYQTAEGEGKTIAVVCLDTLKVFFIDNSYRKDTSVKEAIDEVLKSAGKEN